MSNWLAFNFSCDFAAVASAQRQGENLSTGDQTLARPDQDFTHPAVIADRRVPPRDTSNNFHHDAGSEIVICLSPDSIPPGRQPTKRLLCGFPGCTSLKLFDRKYELERHMATHLKGTFKCPVEGCPRKDVAFKRNEHLRNHLRNLHGRR